METPRQANNWNRKNAEKMTENIRKTSGSLPSPDKLYKEVTNAHYFAGATKNILKDLTANKIVGGTVLLMSLPHC